MRERRLVGIDLGIASAHAAQVLRADGSKVCRHHCWPRLDSLLELEQAALADAPEGTRLEEVMEPTGPAWWSIAVYFIRRGHLVYRVSSAKAHDLRRFLSRHAKSNSIDALTLAKGSFVHVIWNIGGKFFSKGAGSRGPLHITHSSSTATFRVAGRRHGAPDFGAADG